MSPLSWTEPVRYDRDEIDRIRDWAESRCDGPTTVRHAIRLWETSLPRRPDHLAKRSGTADTARSTTQEENPS